MILICSYLPKHVLSQYARVLRPLCLVLSIPIFTILGTALASKPLAAQDHVQNHDQDRALNPAQDRAQYFAQDHVREQIQDRDQNSDQPPALPHGVPYDWSHHHLIFSNPGTAEDAMRKGTYDHWFQTVNDPRYVQHQIWNHRRRFNEGPRDVDRRYEPANTGLWGESLGSATATVGAGMYPAKYSFDSDVLNCATASQPDFVVYNTSVAGSGTQATLVAYDNLYSGTCPTLGGHTVPQVYWSYNTGLAVGTSVVLSNYGNPIAFVQSSGTVASLVILRFVPGQGTSAAAPVSPDNTQTCAVTTGACTTQAAAFVACEKTASSCELVLQFAKDTVAGTSPNDSNSPPYYDYTPGSDTIWVGDNNGYMHKFTGVFEGMPSEVVGGGWPIQASTQTSPILTGAVYDSTSGLIFVNDATGYLHSIKATAPTGSLVTSTQMECGAGFKDPPIVDSTTEEVYAFIAYGCDGTHNSYINRFAAGTALNANGGYGTALSLANGGATNPTTSIARDGSFDNTYFTGTGNTGNLYYCEDGNVFQIPVTTALTTERTFNKVVTTIGSAANCSPITEYYGTSATTTLSANLGMGTGNTTASVISTSGFTVGTGTYYVQIDSEIMLLTGVTPGGPSLTVTRGQLGTARAMHTTGATVNEIHDWLFMSVLAGGNGTGCTGSCVYNYDVLAGATTGTSVTGMQVVGGTSGITIDNTALNGGSQIYFSFGASATGTTKCPTPSGATSGGCAVQAAQLGLN